MFMVVGPGHDVMSVVERTRLWAEYKDKSKFKALLFLINVISAINPSQLTLNRNPRSSIRKGAV